MSTTRGIIIATRCTKLLRAAIYASASRATYHRATSVMTHNGLLVWKDYLLIALALMLSPAYYCERREVLLTMTTIVTFSFPSQGSHYYYYYYYYYLKKVMI